MADTIREKIIQAAVAALNNGTPGGVPQTTRLKATPYQTADLPAMDIRPGREEMRDKQSRTQPVVLRDFSFVVTCYAKGDAVDKLLDPLIAWATKVLAGNRLGGLAHDIEESDTEWDFEHGDALYGVASITFAVTFQTKTADQEAKA